jgi:hypothetical protein
MWGLLGDGTPGPPGTFFYREPGHKAYFWYLLDQVLVRPDLLDRLENKNVQILDTDGERSLLKANGRPDSDIGSDHLPLLVRLNL